jgi:hypothetical protein
MGQPHVFIFGRRKEALEVQRFNAAGESKRLLTKRLRRTSLSAHCQLHLKRRSGLLIGSQ